MRKLIQQSLIYGALSCATLAALGQQNVHAVAGKVTAIYPATNTIKVVTDDGSGNIFEVLTKSTPLNFPKSVRLLTTPALNFDKKEDQVVVFYFGDDNVRTTVALEDLGPSPLVKSVGAVVKLDKQNHVLTIKNAAGAEETFHIDAKTVAEGSSGVIEGEKFEAAAGQQVRITASSANGSETALFIRPL